VYTLAEPAKISQGEEEEEEENQSKSSSYFALVQS